MKQIDADRLTGKIEEIMGCDAKDEWAKGYDAACEQIIGLVEEAPIIEEGNPEKDCKESQEWCADCEHIEMCRWYPTQGCEFKGGLHPELRKKWSKQGLFPDGFGGARVGYTCPYCKKYVPYAGRYCGKCGKRVLGGDE